MTRVFLGLSDICGYYSQLERGLRNQGVDTVFVNAFPDRPYERATKPDLLGRVVEWLGTRRASAPRGSARRKAWLAAQAVALPLYGASAALRFDVFIFASGQSFLLGYDRALLRALGKRVISVCHGTDARPPYMNGAIAGTEGEVDAHRLIAETKRVHRFVRNLERSSDAVVNHPLTGQFHRRPFINWMKIGIPIAPLHAERSPIARTEGETMIVHAPTRPGPKGTDRIEAAIEALRHRGYKIRFEKIVGRPNSEVLDALAACDFIVDELFSDTPVAGFAAEAAFFGKPAIVGSYGADLFAALIPEELGTVCLACHPDGVEQAIETLITDKELRRRIGESARAFVTAHWSAENVAKRFLRLIQGDIPADWWFAPEETRHAYGWGVTRARLAKIVEAMVEAGGTRELGVEDKTFIERTLLGLVRGQKPSRATSALDSN